MEAPGRHFAVIGIAISLLATLITGFAVGHFAGDGSAKAWILSYAGSAELFGVLLVASPELLPRAKRALVWIRSGWNRIKKGCRLLLERIKRLLGKEPPPKHVELKLSDVGGTSDAALALHAPPAGDLGEKVDFLIRRDRANQERFQALEQRIGALPAKWQGEMQARSRELQVGFEEALRELEDRHISARLLGLSLLIVGIILNTWGNLL
jgi:hypothetical protein